MDMLAELRDDRRGRKHRLRLSDAISCGLFLRDVGYWQRERTRSDGQSCTRCSSSPAYCPPGVLSRRQSVTSFSLATSRRRSQSASDVCPLDECTVNGRDYATPATLFRHRDDFCSFYLIIEYRAVLMMYGFKHALDTNVIAVA
jgi:Pyruvate/2-oxoacid:ferredoxin oxidoreductase delta subunit